MTNDAEATRRVVEAFRGKFPATRIQETEPTSASEDFGCFGSGWHSPSVFWFVVGIDESTLERARSAGRLSEIPTNHNPRFAPAIHPTLQAGIEAMVVAAWPG